MSLPVMKVPQHLWYRPVPFSRKHLEQDRFCILVDTFLFSSCTSQNLSTYPSFRGFLHLSDECLSRSSLSILDCLSKLGLFSPLVLIGCRFMIFPFASLSLCFCGLILFDYLGVSSFDPIHVKFLHFKTDPVAVVFFQLVARSLYAGADGRAGRLHVPAGPASDQEAHSVPGERARAVEGCKIKGHTRWWSLAFGCPCRAIPKGDHCFAPAD